MHKLLFIIFKEVKREVGMLDLWHVAKKGKKTKL